jgi:hypothetical protein
MMCVCHPAGAQTNSAKQDSIPQWVRQMIKSYSAEPPRSPRAVIYKGEYKGQVVYSIPQPWCCDLMSLVRTADGKTICEFGGIAGINTCKDFDEEFKNRVVLWEDKR